MSTYNYGPPQRGSGGLGPWVWVLIGGAGVALVAMVVVLIVMSGPADNTEVAQNPGGGAQPVANSNVNGATANGGNAGGANVNAQPPMDLDSIPIGLNIGQRAPEIEGEDIDGVAFKLSDYRGKVVVLDFWGDW